MQTYERIKEAVKNTGMKQFVIAERCGYDATVFSRMLNGRRPIYDKDIVKISCGLGVTPNDLLGFNESA